MVGVLRSHDPTVHWLNGVSFKTVTPKGFIPIPYDVADTILKPFFTLMGGPLLITAQGDLEIQTFAIPLEAFKTMS